MFKAAQLSALGLILVYVSFSFTESTFLSAHDRFIDRPRHVTCAPEARGAYGETRGAPRRSPANPVLLEIMHS